MSDPRSNESDENLMAEVVAGKLAALEPLIERYQNQLFAYAARVLNDREKAADVFQETFLRVFQKRHTYRLGAPFRPWLYRICLNLCRDEFRRQKRGASVDLEARQEVRDPGPGPAERTFRQDLSQQVRSAVMGLPEKQQKVFLLVHYQGLSYPEVAEVLEIPVGTVKSRMFHASKRLAEELQELRAEI
ncbi:MAG: RNA polymerase sigma factor [Vulcanimicrobiota bacterium]